MLRFFIGYLLVGQVINWGTVFFVILTTVWKCWGRNDVIAELNAEDRKTQSSVEWGPDTASKLYFLWRIVITAVLWPRNVVIMLFNWSDQMKMADELIRAKSE